VLQNPDSEEESPFDFYDEENEEVKQELNESKRREEL
jgi:hypothetical protein